MPLTQGTYRLRYDVTFLSREWDGECVVYNTASGETILLDTLAARILLLFDSGSLHHDVLLNRIAGEFEHPEEARNYLSATLEHFLAMDLLAKAGE